MSLPGLRRVGALLDRLLRPAQAARNAHDAASEATRTVLDREAIERDVEEIEDNQSSGE